MGALDRGGRRTTKYFNRRHRPEEEVLVREVCPMTDSKLSVYLKTHISSEDDASLKMQIIVHILMYN